MRTLVRVTCSIVVLLFAGDPALLAQGRDHKKFQMDLDMSSGTHSPMHRFAQTLRKKAEKPRWAPTFR